MKIRPIIILIVVLIIISLGGGAYAGMRVWLEKLDTRGLFSQNNKPVENREQDNSSTPSKQLQLFSIPSECKNVGIPWKREIKIVKEHDLEFIADELIIVFPDGTNCSIVDDVVNQVNGRIVQFIPSPDTYLIVLPVKYSEELFRAQNLLEKDPRVKWVKLNTTYKLV